jgi:hypothetical protein
MRSTNSCLRPGMVLRHTAFVAVVGMILTGRANADLYYWQNFEGGDGTPEVTLAGGNLAIRNTGVATTAFSSTGGIFGGSWDGTSNPALGSTGGIASTAVAGGTPIDLSGLTGQITISMWVKVQTFTNTVGGASRLFVLGSSGITDINQSNSMGFAQLSGGGAFEAGDGQGTKFLAYLGSGTSGDLTGAGGVGAVNNVDEWTFIAFSYDGTSSFGDDSAVQSTATGSAINGQFYRGTATESVVRNPLPVTVTGQPGDSSKGVLGMGSNGIVHLGNRTNSNLHARSLDGWIDDVRIYDAVLSAAQVDAVRVAGLFGTATVPGDFNFDGDVDGDDFAAWQMNFPKASEATLGEGDADGDGDVDGADFVAWQTNFPFNVAESVSQVPEPGAFILAGMGLTGIGVLRLRRKYRSGGVEPS